MPYKILLLLCSIAFLSLETIPYKMLQGQAQGTTYRIIYEDKLGVDLSKSIDSLFNIMDASMSLWDSNSLISKINANTYSGVVDQHFKKVFLSSQHISKKTNGYFDVTVGPLVKAWGFSKTKGLLSPTELQLDSLRKLVNYKNISLKAGRITKKYPNIQLDFNAIAQGYTVDLIADFLSRRSIANYLVEIGGEVRASGKNQNAETWKVGVENPSDENKLQAVVALDNQSLATSGSYRKFFLKDGKKYSHAIDPHVGKPVTHNLLSVTVIAKDCATADAYATAFLVMGLVKAKMVATKQKIDFLAIYEENGKIQTFSSAGFKRAILE
ncbi:ApbE Membrane-associated lipoprotein involved in thiamine biosynthesis [Spirosomataceae bacterium]|jgi:FAD:protein FMN transferase